MPNESQLKNCLNTNVPQTDETLLECNEFLDAKCIIAGEVTQEDINNQVADLQTQVIYLTQQFTQNISTNNIVKLLSLGAISDPINEEFNSQAQFSIGRNEIYIVKATISGVPSTFIFTKGKGLYGTGGTATTINDFIQI